MPDSPIVPPLPPEPPSTEQSDPHKKGVQTSEFKLTLAATIAGVLLTGISTTLGQLAEAIPDNRWILGAVGIVGGVVAFLLPILKYLSGRETVKDGQLKLEAAKVHAAMLGRP